MNNRTNYCILVILLFVCNSGYGQTLSANFEVVPQYIKFEASQDVFPIASTTQSATIYIDSDDWKGTIRAAYDLSNDIEKVTGITVPVSVQTQYPDNGAIIIGTIGKSRIIDRLIEEKKIQIKDVEGQWESFLIQTVDGNLIIAGSDKRGTIYGIYDISEKIGVSPWYWWADVPVKKNKSLYVKNGRYVQPSPKVKYRGIFINDEWPSFGGWTSAKFGGFNSKMYAYMFELLLRLKANYLWPAMWSAAFNEDDPINPVLADEYGIVMGTSHHEPMMRAHKEYTKRREEVGPWDYALNKDRLDKFFFEGIDRNKNFDNLITVGMRGDGDVAMGKGSDEENIRTLYKVIEGQREIIARSYGKSPSEVPQLWAIFTEVQRYYDAGFTVPDDIMLMFCDNNWGYIRRIGPPHKRNHPGGLGLYYHIDMNGGPWNDRWVNTTTIPKLREQLNLAYQTGLDALWVTNVGDLKPKEFPIDFILRYAWNPDNIPADKVQEYTVNWAEKIFGKEYAEEIADLVSKYSKYNLLRKPEVQHTRIFSYVNYHEADRMLQQWHDIVDRVEQLKPQIAPEAQDAFYQLVYYPIKASAGVAEIYLAAGKNNLYAQQGRVSANDYAKRVRELFEQDKQLSDYYNDTLSGGKWKKMMSDIHIGYTKWSMPEESELPALSEVKPLEYPAMGVAVEGSEQAWPNANTQAELPVFDILNNQSYYIDVFNRGTNSFEFKTKANKPWIKLSHKKGVVSQECRLQVTIDWDMAPEGNTSGIIEIQDEKNIVPVHVTVIKADIPQNDAGFYGGLTGEFSIPADKYHANTPGKYAQWITLPDLGRNDACMGIYPVTAPSSKLEDAPVLKYNVYLPKSGKTTVCVGILPTQDIYPERGLRFAIGLDNEEPQIIDARKGMVDTFNEYTPENISRSKVLKALPTVPDNIALIAKRKPRRNEIFDNLRWLDVELDVKEAGIHTLNFYMVDPEIVLEILVVNPDNKYPSYFGAPSRMLSNFSN